VRFSRNYIRDSGEPDSRYSAKRGLPREEKRDIEGIETYLTNVEGFLSDQATCSAVKFEYSRLAEIADDEILPELIRERASKLRDLVCKVA
jgi:hypothetical protein